MNDPFQVKVDSYLAEWLDPYLGLIASSVLRTDRDARRERDECVQRCPIR